MIETVLPPLQQWLLFSGTLLLVGCVAWRFVVAPGAIRATGGRRAEEIAAVSRGVATTGLVVTLLLVLVWGLRLVVQLMGFRDPFVPLSEDLDFLVRDTFWGTVWVWQGALLPLLAAAFWLARGRGGRAVGAEAHPGGAGAWSVATVLVVALVLTLALSSHAMGVDPGRNVAVAADALHALAGGAWMGSLALILAFGRSGAPGSPLLAAQLRSFSPLAMACVTVLVVMGVYLSWIHLPAPAALWETSYGRVLAAKVGAAGVVLLLGLLNWRRGLPSLDTVEGVRRVRLQAGWEISVAVLVLLLTGILTQTPQP